MPMIRVCEEVVRKGICLLIIHRVRHEWQAVEYQVRSTRHSIILCDPGQNSVPVLALPSACFAVW